MAWISNLAGRAESLLNNLDEQTGAALRNHNVGKTKKHDGQIEPPWSQKKRPIARNVKKAPVTSIATEVKSGNFAPIRKPLPTSSVARPSLNESSSQPDRRHRSPSRKSPARKSNTQFNLNHVPMTWVGDMRDDKTECQFVSKRRNSLPTDLELLDDQNITHKLQNYEVENAMLKNELNVMNSEVSELLHRLRKTEDGNVVVNGFSSELTELHMKSENTETQNQRLCTEMQSQNKQLQQLKHKINELTNVEISKHKERKLQLETELNILNEKNLELENIIKQQEETSSESKTTNMKLENDLRHSQSVINDLQTNLEKSNGECLRLEKDWEAYKLRVKGMLHSKDNEIKALQDGIAMSEDTKALISQIESLKNERDSLTDAVTQVRNECGGLKQYITQLETRHSAAERIVTALRDAIRDERDAKNLIEVQYQAMSKELKSVQAEAGQTIASLRTALREKENELTTLQNTTSTDTSALNVADYDVMQQSIDNDRIHYLTETLVQKQGKIDTLLADNNMLKIQLEKLENKYKSETAALRGSTHVVGVPEGVGRARVHAEPSLSTVSLRIGVMMRRYPVFRMFIVIYMICLHLWVLTVLFTSTPEGHFSRHIRS